MKQTEAKRLGLPRYHGKICSKHPELGGERYTAGWCCVRCALDATLKHARTLHGRERILRYKKTEEQKSWRRAHRRKEYVRLYENKYKQSERGRDVRFKINNSPQRKAYMAEYCNRPEQKAKRALRSRWFEQHLSKFATPKWANQFLMGKIYELSSLCSKTTGIRHEIDHIVPLVSSEVCGLHVEDNLRIVHHSVNRTKSNKLIQLLTG